METRTRERLVGAAVLVGLIVLLVPAMLTGPGPREDKSPAAGQRSVEILLAPAPRLPSAAEEPVPDPGLAQPAAAAPVAEVPAGPQAAVADTAEPAAAVAASPAAPPLRPGWAVQLGAFSTQAAAEKLVAELRGRGYPAFLSQYRADGKLLHRVRAGPEEDRGRAEQLAERLRRDGYRPVVTAHP